MIITINAKSCTCEPGEYLFEIAKRNGITIPTLCHHHGLPGQGCCRVCLVEVEIDDRRSIVTACVYPVERECVVYTESDRVVEQRRIVLSMLSAFAPESDEVARLCEVYVAPEHERFFRRDGEKCILCGLCVKACESLGTGAISTINRGIEKAVSTPYNELSVVCVGCASCAKVCPVGAIEVIEEKKTRTIWKKTFPLLVCKKCGSTIGTLMEIKRASQKAEVEVSALCDACKKKLVTDVMASAFGR